MKFGFHASHEQFAPSELLRLVVRAEEAGFDAAMCSDHFAPFSETQGQSGFAWSWLGAALNATRLSFGTVSAPGYRYHPAILAQALATLGEMFPGRAWVALGSGEYLNERVTGTVWPAMDERRARLRECAGIIQALLRGETVQRGDRIQICEAKLYTRPAVPPKVFAASVSPESAALVAPWADGLITVNQPREQLRKVVDAFRANGGSGKPMFLQVHVAWAPSDAEALEEAYAQWRANAFTGELLWDVPGPRHLDAAARFVRREDLHQSVRIASSFDQHVEWLGQDAELGFDGIYLHEVGRKQERFVDNFGAHVLPKLR